MSGTLGQKEQPRALTEWCGSFSELTRALEDLPEAYFLLTSLCVISIHARISVDKM